MADALAPDLPVAAGEGKRQRLAFVFHDGAEAFAIPPGAVLEVMAACNPTPMPFSPPWLPGVLHARGEIVPVLDLRRYLGLDPAKPGPGARLLLIEVDGNRFATWSDRIAGILALDEEDLQPPLGNLPKALLECTPAHFRRNEELVHVLDLAKLLRDAKAQVGTGP